MVEKVKPLETEDDDAGEDGKRQRSAIAFPYTDYENVEVLASAIHTHAGHGTCSAQQTGFRSIAPNRLVMPAVVTKDEKTPDEHKRKNGDGGDGRDRTGLNLDPLLVALLNKIPEQGQEWPAEKRLRWFKTFAMN